VGREVESNWLCIMPLMSPTQRSRNPGETRFPASAALSIAILVVVACNAQPAAETAAELLAPLEPIELGTGVIFPREEGASRFLIAGWPPQQTLEGDSMWIHRTWAQVGFFQVADTPPTFVTEARPFAHPDAPQQRLTVLLNDVEIDAFDMRARWTTYEIDLPAGVVHPGWNVIELRFAHSLRPADFDPESDDRRRLAAVFRRLEIRNGAGRPEWPGRPGPRFDADNAIIEMPADSFFEARITPRRHEDLVGAAEVEFAGPQGPEEPEETYGPASIQAVVEIIDTSGALRVWESELRPGARPTLVHAELGGWEGEEIVVRVRVFGDANGVVRWRGFGTIAR